ncbi:MAG: hypothetical protein ACREOO_29845 [bacterium]
MPMNKEVSRPLSTRCLPLILLLCISFSSPPPILQAQAQDGLMQAPVLGKNEKKEFEARAQTLLAYFVEKETRPSFAAVAARYASGERINEAHRMMSQLLSSPRRNPSYVFDLMATYLFGRQNLTPALAAQVKATLGKIPLVHDFSEHEMHLYFAALMLAAETWPKMSAEEWFNGKSSGDNLREAREYFSIWLEKTVTEGQSEYDSPQYMPAMFAALAVLHEFTRDEDFRKRLSIMLHVLMIDFAAEHMGGLYGGAHAGEPMPLAISPREAPSAGFSWLYLGVGKLIPTTELLFSSLSSYEMLNIVQQLAKRRDPIGGFVHQERKRRAPSLRYESDPAGPVCKYTYVTRNYILGSIAGGAFSPRDQQSWGMVYRTRGDQKPVFFITTPSASGRDLAKFHAAEPRILEAEARARNASANPLQAFTGTTNFERIFQHRNVLVGLYGAADSLTLVKLTGFFSPQLDTLLLPASNGSTAQPDWIFAQTGETYFAILPLQPFRFENQSEGRWLISENRHNGFVLEVSTPIESDNFSEFRRRIRQETKIDLSQLAASKMRIKYTTTYGDVMEFAFHPAKAHTERSLNGTTVLEKDCTLFNSPLLKHAPGSKRIVLRFKNEWLELDCEKWEMIENMSTITEELKAQE